MSYNEITPSYYQLLQPGDPWHAGSTGWTRSPSPSWGNNPRLAGPRRQGVGGLGAYYAERENLPINGLGLSPDGLGRCVPCGALTEEQKAADAEFMRRNRTKMMVGAGLFIAMIGGLFWAASRP